MVVIVLIISVILQSNRYVSSVFSLLIFDYRVVSDR
jgi:hypothetical protein